jgi:YD repeat-containing protein
LAKWLDLVAEVDISFGYDAANRKTSETETIKSYGLNQTHTVTYGYDADGNRSGLVYPQGWDYRYAYTNRNQLASVTLAGSGTSSVKYIYDVGATGRAGQFITALTAITPITRSTSSLPRSATSTARRRGSITASTR